MAAMAPMSAPVLVFFFSVFSILSPFLCVSIQATGLDGKSSSDE
jgi:hypothetical protein